MKYLKWLKEKFGFSEIENATEYILCYTKNEFILIKILCCGNIYCIYFMYKYLLTCVKLNVCSHCLKVTHTYVDGNGNGIIFIVIL